jgi:hypothetical protein
MDSDTLVNGLLIIVPILALASTWAYVSAQRARFADDGAVRWSRRPAAAAAWPAVFVLTLVAAVLLLILDAGSGLRYDAPFVLFFGLWAVVAGRSPRAADATGEEREMPSASEPQSQAGRRRAALLPLVAIFAVSIVVRALIGH